MINRAFSMWVNYRYKILCNDFALHTCWTICSPLLCIFLPWIQKTLGWNGKATPPLRSGWLIFNTTKWRFCQKEAAGTAQEEEATVELWWIVRLTLAQVRRGWPGSYTHSAVFSWGGVAIKQHVFFDFGLWQFVKWLPSCSSQPSVGQIYALYFDKI